MELNFKDFEINKSTLYDDDIVLISDVSDGGFLFMAKVRTLDGDKICFESYDDGVIYSDCESYVVISKKVE